MGHTLKESHLILALGSHDLRVAERAAELYLGGLAPKLMFSGGLGTLTAGKWKEPEADLFTEVAINMGVPKEDILIENKSSNTGENIFFSQKILQERGYHTPKIIVVQKPYMERRSYATFKKRWPEPEILITSPQISFEDYPTQEITREQVINIMVGDLQRIKLYPKKGFQIPQKIPSHIWDACEELILRGYKDCLIKGYLA